MEEEVIRKAGRYDPARALRGAIVTARGCQNQAPSGERFRLKSCWFHKWLDNATRFRRSRHGNRVFLILDLPKITARMDDPVAGCSLAKLFLLKSILVAKQLQSQLIIGDLKERDNLVLEKSTC